MGDESSLGAVEDDVSKCHIAGDHRLVDHLPATEFESVRRFLEYLRGGGKDLVSRSLEHAPADDEPLSAGELTDLEEALKDCAAGRVISHENACRRLLGEKWAGELSGPGGSQRLGWQDRSHTGKEWPLIRLGSATG